MTYTYPCSGCLRLFVFPLMRDTDEKMGQSPRQDHYTVTCVCGTENRYPLMAVLPFPLKPEVSVA